MHFKINMLRLSNGAHLVHIKTKSLPYSAVSVWFRAGARFDPKGQEGLSHFFEHLLLNTTERFVNRSDRLFALESAGIYFNAYTDYETARYLHIQPANKTMVSLDYLIEGLNSTRFTQERIDEERAIILNESLSNQADSSQYLWRLSQQALWPKSMLGRGFFGNKSSLSSVRLRDIIAFHKAFYTTSNATFVIISNEPTKAIQSFIENNLALTRGRSVTTRERFARPKSKLIEHRPTEMVTVGFNYRIPGMNQVDQQPTTDLLREMLAGRWIALLNRTLRVDANLTYWVDGISEYFKETGYTRFSYDVLPSNLNRSLQLAQEQFDRFSNETVRKDFLQAVKISYESDLIRRLQNPEYLLWWFGWNAVLNRKPVSPSAYLKQMRAVTPEMIKRSAKRIFNQENESLVLIGPVK